MGILKVSRGQYKGYEVILKGAINYEVDANVDVNSNDFLDMGELRFASTGTPTSSEVAITGLTGDMYINVLTNDSLFIRENGSTICEIDADGIDIKDGYFESTERSLAPSGSANSMRLYCVDVGGKTTAFIIFGTGAAQQIAQQP